MRRFSALLLPVLSLGLVQPAVAQGSNKEIFEAQQYNFAAKEYKAQMDIVAQLDQEIGKATDLKSGCEKLQSSITHLQKAEELLVKMAGHAEELRRRGERENAVKQRTAVQNSIKIKQGDNDRLCKG